MATTRLKRLQLRTLIFSGLALALLAVVLFRPGTTQDLSLDSFPELLPSFDRDKVAQLSIVQQDPDDPDKRESVALKRRGDSWVLADRFDHPVQAATVDNLLDALEGARLKKIVTERENTFEKYRPSTGWIHIAARDAAGGALADVAMGRAESTDLFVRIEDQGKTKIARTTKLRPSSAPLSTTSWIETRIWPGSLDATSMVRLDIDKRKSGGELVTVVKRGSDSAKLQADVPPEDPDDKDKKRVWWMTSPAMGDARTLEVEDRARSFTGFVVADVVAQASDADLAKYGFDKPAAVVTFWHMQGDAVVKHTLELGGQNEAKDAWFVRSPDRNWIYRAQAGHMITSLRASASELAAPVEAPEAPEEPGTPDDEGK